MITENFTVLSLDKGNDLSYYASYDLQPYNSTPWFIVPAGVRKISVSLDARDDATAIVQTTIDEIKNIKNEDYEINYENWPKGEINGREHDNTVTRVNAIRAVHTGGIGIVKFVAAC